MASPGLFYPPAFAALTGWYGPRRVQALTALGRRVRQHDLRAADLGCPPGGASRCGAGRGIRGVFTFTEATLVVDYWGSGRHAVVNGVFNAPLTAAGAVAPSVGAAIAAATGSYPVLFTVLAVLATAGAGLAAAARSRAGRTVSLAG